ncbi:hypothetical protein K1X76_03655 [bacterium]|nr:hypothetical protein [bacterium]
MKKLHKLLILLVFIAFNACGGSSGGGSSNDDGTGPTLDVTTLGTKRTLSFTFSTDLTDPDTAEVHSYDGVQTLQVPIYFKANPTGTGGTASVAAQDFPKMIVRICRDDVTDTDCQSYLPEDDLGTIKMVDLVIDSCGSSSDSKCGVKDTSVYVGPVTKAGDMTINAVNMRVRAFVIGEDDADAVDGYTAKDTDSGLFSGRIPAQITTGTVKGISGSKISGNAIKMISVGVIPGTFPEMAGFSYTATIEGTFDQDPLALIP